MSRLKAVLFIFILFSFLNDAELSAAANATEADANELNLEFAKKINAKAMACGKKNNWKFSVSIVNSEGNLILFQRDDGAYFGSIDASMDKAKSANAFQRPTKAFVDGVKVGNLGLLSVKGVVANEGGVPILMNGVHVGAIGISGAKAFEDELCAKMAIE